MMPPSPRAHFIITHAQILFAVLKAGFNGPPHAAHPHQRRQWGVRGRITQRSLQFPGVYMASPDQPPLGSRPPLADPNHPQGGKRRHEWALTPLLDRLLRPGTWLARRQRAQPWREVRRCQPPPGRASACAPGPTTPGRQSLAVPASPACRGALRRNTTSPAQPSGRAAWYHGRRLRHRRTQRQRRLPAWWTAWIIAPPSTRLVVNPTSAGTPQAARRSAYASSSSHSCGRYNRRSSNV